MKGRKANYALAAAFLFGISTPASKLLLRESSPLTMAALLYLGSGIGLLLWRVAFPPAVAGSSRISRRDWLNFLGSALCGGIVAPVLLMLGLARTSSSVASLLLNFEAPMTALIACLIYREHYGKRLVFGMALIVAGGIVLARPWSGPAEGGIAGLLFVAGACLGWAIDNNLTRQIASVDATMLAMAKGLVAGAVNLTAAFLLKEKIGSVGTIGATLLLGFISYGWSMVYYIFSLRKVGVARSSAYFATAPFLGAFLSMLLFREQLSISLVIDGALMAWGIGLHLTEKRESS